MSRLEVQKDVARAIATLEDLSIRLSSQAKVAKDHIEQLKPSAPSTALAAARSLIRTRLAARATFKNDLFQDPAFDMLLTVFVAGEERYELSGTAVIAGGGVPPTTGLRWLTKLEALGMIRRENHQTDKRRQIITLTEETRDRMLEWLTPPSLL